jgi:class 3 adenylate cyclase
MDFETLALAELIRLQGQLSEVLTRRFERPLAVAFSDVVGSSAYTARHGDEAGRVLQQRHLDLVGRALGAGRIVDTAGDGAFLAFPDVASGIAALSRLHQSINEQATADEHRLAIRTGLHFGKALTDGTVVSGDAVNFCARVTSSALPGEIRLTRAAFHELGSTERARCRALPLVTLKDFGGEIPVFAYEWRDLSRFPAAIRVVETGVELPIPDKDLVTIGRLRTNPTGSPANDLVLALPDADKAVLISRWHLELRRRPDGMVLRSISDRVTEVNGSPIDKGVDVPIKTGDVARLSGVLSLAFVGESLTGSALSTRGS